MEPENKDQNGSEPFTRSDSFLHFVWSAKLMQKAWLILRTRTGENVLTGNIIDNLILRNSNIMG